MSSKHITFLFIGLALVGLVTAGVGAFKKSVDVTPVPTPTPEQQLFNPEQGQTQETNLQPDSQDVPKKQVKQYKQFPGILAPEELKSKKAVIETAAGDIEFEIYPEATKAASNFIFLARDGFYDGLTFHRVEPGFVIQGGDPVGNGTGNPGYKFEDEPVTRKYDKGIVAMANSGPDTNGSQFFIMLADRPDLPPNYTIFGKVVSGQSAVGRIKVGSVMDKVSIIDSTKVGP